MRLPQHNQPAAWSETSRGWARRDEIHRLAGSSAHIGLVDFSGASRVLYDGATSAPEISNGSESAERCLAIETALLLQQNVRPCFAQLSLHGH